MTQPLSCSIVLPCYNPPEGWQDIVINNVREIQQKINAPVEVVLVNDGSTQGIDDTHVNTLAAELDNFIYKRMDINKGKGDAIRDGVADARMDIIIYTDVDFPYTTGSFIDIYNVLKSDSTHMAMGIKDKQYYSHVPVIRMFISRLLRYMIQLFINIPVTDTQCGLKGFKKEVKQEFLSTTIERYLFDLEFVYKMHRKKYVVQPIEVSLKDNIIFSKMNYKLLLPEIWNFIRVMSKQV